MTSNQLRRRWRQYCALPLEQRFRGMNLEFQDMTCGAKTRKGTPCRMTLLLLYPNGRCKFHGGASTGPRTKRGKARSARNGFQRKSAKPASKRKR